MYKIFGMVLHSHLIKDLSDICFRLSKPHREQLRSFDGDEICLALIGNGFGQQSLTTTRGTIEQHTLGWGHAKLEELVWVLHWVLNKKKKIIKILNLPFTISVAPKCEMFIPAPTLAAPS